MPNTRNLRLGPNATYIPLTGVGGNAKFRFGVGGKAVFLDTNMLVYLMQNCGVGGLSQRQDPTPRVFVAVEYRLLIF